MKKILTILVLMFVLIGCASDSENLYEKYNSLEEINKKTNTHLIKPGVMGITNERFFILDNNTSDYVFDLNGYEYYMRGCKDTTIDMSGVFENGKQIFEDQIDKQIAFARSKEYLVARFILGGKQYVFGVKDNGEMDTKTFEDQFDEVYKTIIYESTTQDIINLLGEYQDINSQRASATIELFDVNRVLVNIKWPSSANQEDEWKAYCSYVPGRLDYEQIEHYKNTYNNDGSVTTETLNDFFPGYFETEENCICWSGSRDDTTSSCKFEKIQ